MPNRDPSSTETVRLPKIRRWAAPLVGAAAMVGGAGYAVNVYSHANEPTTTANGEHTTIIAAAQQYLGPEGNDARCTDEELASISRRVAAIPDDEAQRLLESGALGAQAEQFNSLGADEVTAEDLEFLLTHVPQTPNTQCGRPGGTSTNELLTKGPLGLGLAAMGSLVIAFHAGAARVRRGLSQ